MACDTSFEDGLRPAGFGLIAGVDEVGRGAVAGPVVAAAVILDAGDVPQGINDSKKLTRAQRERLAVEIESRAVAFCVARIEHFEIDKINIHRASLEAMTLAVKGLQPQAEYVLIDGRFRLPKVNCPQLAIIKGDGLSVSVAAASILAKVSRDRWMREYDVHYPGYGFASHVGYNTRAHQEAIARLGPSAIHRLTFNGVQTRQGVLDLSMEEVPLSSLSNLE
ncbi:MAG TPA: ribonuclease HII [Blastocatellia bacterium]|nr:ribonuclease HII [Blastocatellia bacterium]